ncbi:MAG: c-type cytochrome [Mucilaginibacter sp.]
MKKTYQYTTYLFILVIITGVLQLAVSCNAPSEKRTAKAKKLSGFVIDTSKIPHDKFGEAVRYGRELMLHTAYYIGPEGINGKYAGNKMNCSNCHQDAGTKPYSFNLVATFRNYPQYRAREGRVSSLAERVNNCITRPLLGKPLPLDSKEMIAIMSWLKWIGDVSHIDNNSPGVKNVDISFPDTAASSKNGEHLYAINCARCHGQSGEGQLQVDKIAYTYPPLWGLKAYQPGSSMHRIVKMAQWLVSNMPYDKATHDKPFLTSAQALDLAAFINDDSKHQRTTVKDFQYPNYGEKPVDYDRGPFNDPFSATQHKYGPFKPIINYWAAKGFKPTY